jgi:hypothetical protein
MSGDAGMSWIPWRAVKRVRWTVAIAICVLAIVVAAQPKGSWTSGLGDPDPE